MEAEFNILIVDDEPNIRSGLARGLASVVDTIETAGSVNEALDKFDAGNFQLVISDVRLPGDRDGLELISLVQREKPGTTAIVITAHGSLETAVDAMRRGAFNFISKPVDLQLIRQQVSRAVDHHRLQVENQHLKEKLAAAGEISGIVGNSQTIEELLSQIRQVASTDATVTIQGESGTGNVRQLRNVIGRVVVTSTNDVIRKDDLPEDLSEGKDRRNHRIRTLAEITETAEKAGIQNALAANDYHREKTAKSLGVSVRTLHYKMNKYDLH
ncbi:MAG: response regulator [Phycisphaera sp. RhM]|nr:response regulator [Phycisphaera sp. RhM]